MDNFQIESAQNVKLEQHVASLWDRIIAFLIDGLVIILYAILMSLGLNGLGLDSGEMWVYYLVLGLPFFVYHLFFETFWNGRSLGKAAMKVRVVMLDGSAPAFSNYAVRWLLRFVDIKFTSGSVAVVVILLNGKGQRLGDIAAGTTVISERGQVAFRQMLIAEIPDNHQPHYPQVQVFSDREIQTIKEMFIEAKAKGNHRIILSLSEKVAKVMEVVPKENPMKFLETVLLDYKFYTQN